jgi:putative ABC transport system permease protein
MTSALAQARAVVSMSLAGLPGRVWPTLAAVFAIALTVLTLLVFLAMAAGFSRTVASTGSDDIAIIMSNSAKAEATSRIPAEAVRLLRDAPGVVRGEVSPEAFMVIEATKRTGGETANVSLRGVTPVAASVRPDFAIVEGRMFTAGTNELVVGASMMREFDGFALGQEKRLGNLSWKVVGVFEVGQSVFDSEVWGDLSTVQALLGRSDGVQAVRARLKSPKAIEELKAFVAAEPRLRVDVKSEREHFVGQAGKLQLLISFGWALSLLLAVGALAGALNTMYAAVEARASENATLRAIGFGRWSVFAGAMAESLAIAVVGALLAATVALCLFNGMSASTLGEGFTQVVFQFAVGPEQLMAGFMLALVLGVVGGVFPAVRAATAPVLKLGA